MRLLWFRACPARGRLLEPPLRAPFVLRTLPPGSGESLRVGFRGIAAASGPQCDNFLFLQKARALPKSPDRRPGARVFFASRTPSLGSRPAFALWPSRTTKRDRPVPDKGRPRPGLELRVHHLLDVAWCVLPRLFALGESGGLRRLRFTSAPSLRPCFPASAPSIAHPLRAVFALSGRGGSRRPRCVSRRDVVPFVWLVLRLKQYIAAPEPCSYILPRNRAFYRVAPCNKSGRRAPSRLARS